MAEQTKSKVKYGNNTRAIVDVLTKDRGIISLPPRQVTEVEGGLDEKHPVVAGLLKEKKLTKGGLSYDPSTAEAKSEETEKLRGENEAMKAKIAELEAKINEGKK